MSWPGVQDSFRGSGEHRPFHRRRVLLRFRIRQELHAAGSRRDRIPDAGDRQGGLSFERREVSRSEALRSSGARGEYKVELLNDLPEEVKAVTLYTQNATRPLPRAPLPSTG